MAQQVQRGDEVTPLDQLAQRAAAEGVLRYFEARLLGQQAQVHQDLMEGGESEELQLEMRLFFMERECIV